MKKTIALSMALLMSTAVYAAEPVNADKFNTEPGFDLSTLTAENFYDVLVPLAKTEGTMTFYDFTDSFGPLFNDHIIPGFEAKYGVKIEYVRGESEVANQQLIAARNSGAAAPADAYFVSSSDLPLLFESNVIANLPLHTLLPSGAAIDPAIATVTRGIQHNGQFLTFHRNQTDIVVDTRTVPLESAPTNLDALLTWAQANPKKFAMTSPANGGSGSGFLQTVSYAKVAGDDCRATFTKWDINDEQADEFAAGDCMKPVWDYFNALVPVAEVTNGNSDTLNLVANGAASVGTAWEDMAYDFMSRGLLPPTVRQQLLEEGQVGGGDGLMFPVAGEHPASGLLLLDYLMSNEVQLNKLKVNGSRSARTDIDPAANFTPEQVARLIPTDQFSSRALQNMPSKLTSALTDYFTANILRQ